MSDLNKLFESFKSDAEHSQNFENATKQMVPDIATELKIMTKVYEEQLEAMIRVRFDAEIFRMLNDISPNAENAEGVKKSDDVLFNRRIAIAVIRRQIEELVKKMNS